MKYETIRYWSADDDTFIAEVPELPGCAADGGARAEALKNVETVIQEWIETAANSVVPFRTRRAGSCSPEMQIGVHLP